MLFLEKLMRGIPLLIIITCCLTCIQQEYACSQNLNGIADSLVAETEVQIDSGTYSLFGSLMVPPSKEKIPVILIIPGSGPTDRNGNNPYGLSTDSYRLLARELYKAGIASLRFDKRGVGKSQPALPDESRLVIDTYVFDAGKWFDLLRKDPRFSSIIILGHSEGALIGSISANFQRADGFISVSGMGFPADTIILKQIAAQSPALADTAREIINHIKKDEPFHTNEYLSPIFRPAVALYLKSWFSFSPAVELSLVRCPVLIIQGSRDLQASMEDARILAAARPQSKLVVIPDMNHVLKKITGSVEENIASYRNPDLPLAPELVPAISSFIFQGLK